MNTYDTQPTGYALPLVLSVLLHTLVVLGMLLVRPAPLIAPAGIEASFVSQEDIDAAQDALQAHHQGTMPSAPPTPSPHMQHYNEELARKQAAYQAQIAQFAEQIDHEHQLAIDGLIHELETQRQLEEQILNEARQAFDNQDQLIAENQRQLDEARKHRDQALENAKDDKKSGQLISITAAPNSGNSSTTHTSTNTSGGGDKGNIQAAVSAHIKRFWQPIGETGTRLSASIKVDAGGNVLSVSVSGGTEIQRQSLERAIYASSPITPIIGTEYRSFSPYFVVQ